MYNFYNMDMYVLNKFNKQNDDTPFNGGYLSSN